MRKHNNIYARLYRQLSSIWQRQARATYLLSVCLFALPANAVVVEATLPHAVVASADFRPGNPELPAVLFIHGFLQTPNYQTANSLVDAISDAGYTVLAPTLTLGIDKRRKSLPCEAIHMHTMQEDIAEISYWVDWLSAKSHSNIVIVGNSYGSLQALIYVAAKPNKSVIKVIATSLVDIEHAVGEQNIRAQIELAQTAVLQNNEAPHAYQISYCKKYVAPPKAFLTYAWWLKPRILEALDRNRVPLEVVIGSKDQRMDAHWPDTLKAHNANVSIIQGANHFFDAEHEFDLVDRVLTLIPL